MKTISANADDLKRWYYRAGRLVRRWGPTGLRLALLWTVIAALAPAGPRVLPEAQQVVETQHPIVCVHTQLTDEVVDWTMQRSLQMVREMGATTIVEFFRWAYLEPAENVYDWASADRVITMAHQEGLQIIARVGLVPGWARPRPDEQQTSLNYLDPQHYVAYATFVGAFAAHYRGVVDKIIVWNEPNLSFEWGYRNVQPEEYVQLLQLVYKAAHMGNPDVLLLGAPLAPTLEPAGSPNGLDDVEFLRRVYAAGGASYFDALAVHTYGFTSPPATEPNPTALNFRRFELLHDIMTQYGDGNKPVYITESSWNDDPRWTKAVLPRQRMEYTINAIQWAEQHWPTAKNLCFWYFRSPTLTLSYNDYFAFVTPALQKRPIYDAVRAFTHGQEYTQ